jgi:hypothetical protein
MVAVVSALAYVNALNFIDLGENFPWSDKMSHFVFVGGVAFWIDRGWDDPRVSIGRLSVPMALLLPLVVASLDESLQSLSPHRTAEILDWLSNVAGILTFWLLARTLWARRVFGS